MLQIYTFLVKSYLHSKFQKIAISNLTKIYSSIILEEENKSSKLNLIYRSRNDGRLVPAQDQVPGENALLAGDGRLAGLHRHHGQPHLWDGGRLL